MALSGTVSKRFYINGGTYELRTIWSATQNISNNTSYVKATTQVRSHVGAISGNIRASTYVDGWGSTSDHVINIGWGGGWVNISTRNKTIYHNSDGTGKVVIEGWGDFSHQGGGNVYTGKKTFTLNTIPRRSRFRSSGNLYVPDGRISYSINRASSSFTHKIEVRIAGKVWTYDIGKNTSGNITLSESRRKELAKILYDTARPSLERNFYMVLRTYNGGREIGNDSSGDRKFRMPSYMEATNVPSTSYIDETQYMTFKNHTYDYTYEVALAYYDRNGTLRELRRTYKTGSNSYEINLNEAEQRPFLEDTHDATYRHYVVRVHHRYKDVYMGYKQTPSSSSSARMYVPRNARPRISISSVKNTHEKSVSLLGTDQSYIHGISTLQFRLGTTEPSAYSKIKKITATIGNKVQTWSSSSGWSSATGNTYNVSGTTPIRQNGNLTITVEDARGRRASSSKALKVHDYDKPTVMSYNAERVSGFEEETFLNYKGRVSKITGNINENPTVRTRYRVLNGSWGSWRVLDPQQKSKDDYWELEDRNFYYGLLDNTKHHEIQIEITDVLSSGSVVFRLERGMAIQVYKEDNGYGGNKEYEQIVVGRGSIDGNRSPLLTRRDLRFHDHRNTNESPDWYYKNHKHEEVKEFKSSSAIDLTLTGGFVALKTIVQWSDDTGGTVKQIAMNNSGEQFVRVSESNTRWGSWRELPTTSMKFHGYIDDANKATEIGTYNTNGSTVNSPTNPAMIITFGNTTSMITQVCVHWNRGNIYVRTFWSGSWRDWREVF